MDFSFQNGFLVVVVPLTNQLFLTWAFALWDCDKFTESVAIPLGNSSQITEEGTAGSAFFWATSVQYWPSVYNQAATVNAEKSNLILFFPSKIIFGLKYLDFVYLQGWLSWLGYVAEEQRCAF